MKTATPVYALILLLAVFPMPMAGAENSADFEWHLVDERWRPPPESNDTRYGWAASGHLSFTIERGSLLGWNLTLERELRASDDPELRGPLQVLAKDMDLSEHPEEGGPAIEVSETIIIRVRWILGLDDMANYTEPIGEPERSPVIRPESEKDLGLYDYTVIVTPIVRSPDGEPRPDPDSTFTRTLRMDVVEFELPSRRQTEQGAGLALPAILSITLLSLIGLHRFRCR